MFLLNKTEHALVTIYGDEAAQALSSLINASIPDRDLRILSPKDHKTLEQAAQNSVLTFICIGKADDPNLRLARALKEHRLIVCDLVAYCADDAGLSAMQILG